MAIIVAVVIIVVVVVVVVVVSVESANCILLLFYFAVFDDLCVTAFFIRLIVPFFDSTKMTNECSY